MLQIGQRPLLSERTTPSTHWLPCGGCLENPAASGEEQHHEEIARYIRTKICLLEEKADRLSLAGYGVNLKGMQRLRDSAKYLCDQNNWLRHKYYKSHALNNTLYSYSCDQRIVPSRRDCHRPSIWRIWTHTCQIHRFPTWQLRKCRQIFCCSGFYGFDFCTLRRFPSLQKLLTILFLRFFTKCGTIFWL